MWKHLNVISRFDFDAQNVQHNQKQCFLAWISFVIICRLFRCHNISILFVCLYAKKNIYIYIVFTCVNSLLFLLPFIIFIVLLSFIINLRFNFFLDFHSISLFHLNWKISFGFLPMKEKSLGLLELASKMQEIWPCIEQPMICPKQNKRFKCNRFQHDYRNIWIKNFNEAYIMQM